MSVKNKKTPKVDLSPIGDYCECMRSALRQRGKELSADIGIALSMLQKADCDFREEYGYLEFYVRTSVRHENFDIIQASLKNRIEDLFAGIAAYKRALDAGTETANDGGERGG